MGKQRMKMILTREQDSVGFGYIYTEYESEGLPRLSKQARPKGEQCAL
jgi:hypothetical protein